MNAPRPYKSARMMVMETVDNVSEDEYTDFHEKVVDDDGYNVEDIIEEHQDTFESIDSKIWYVVCQVVDAEQLLSTRARKQLLPCANR
jgi:hypothetical protein